MNTDKTTSDAGDPSFAIRASELREITVATSDARAAAMKSHALVGHLVAVVVDRGALAPPTPDPDPPTPDPDPPIPGPDPEPEPPIPGPPTGEMPVWAQRLPGWAQVRHATLLQFQAGKPAVYVAEIDGPVDLPAALNDALRDARPDQDVVIVTGSGSTQWLGFGDSWNSDVPGRIFNGGRTVVIVAKNEPLRVRRAESRGGLGDHERVINTPKVIIDPRQSLAGGDTLSIRSDHDGTGRLVLVGVEVRCAGRSAIFTHPSAGFEFGMLSCHLATSPRALELGTPMKWGCQFHSVSHVFQDVSADLTGISEHIVYDHSHKSGVPSFWSRTVFTGTGGQPYQGTERPRDGVAGAAAPDVFVVDDSIWTGYHRNVGRAGSALTIAGGNRSFAVLDSTIYDDDPNDTPGAPGKSYGAATVWCPKGMDESYQDLNEQRANCVTLLRRTVLAARDSDRALCEFNDSHEVILSGARFLVAGRGHNPRLNRDVSDGYKSKSVVSTLATTGEGVGYAIWAFRDLVSRPDDYSLRQIDTAFVYGTSVDANTVQTLHFRGTGARRAEARPLEAGRVAHLDVFRAAFTAPGLASFVDVYQAMLTVQQRSPLAGQGRRSR